MERTYDTDSIGRVVRYLNLPDSVTVRLWSENNFVVTTSNYGSQSGGVGAADLAPTPPVIPFR